MDGEKDESQNANLKKRTKKERNFSTGRFWRNWLSRQTMPICPLVEEYKKRHKDN